MAQAPFTINPALVPIVTDYATVNAARRGYIADQVVPRVRVDTPDFRYPTYPVEEAFTVVDDTVGRTSQPNQINQTATETTGSVEDHAMDGNVPFRDEKAATGQLPLPLRARAAREATNKVQMNREIRVASLITTAGNYLTGYKATLSGTTQWSHASSDPVKAINDAADGMLVRPNALVMSKAVHSNVRRHAAVGSALGGSQNSGRYASDDELASILGVRKIIVGDTLYQTSKKGQTLATASIWGKHAALLYIPEVDESGMVDAADADAPAFAKTFQWGDRVAGTIPDPDMGMWGGVRVRSGESLVEKIISQYAGYLFTDAVA